MTKVGAEQVGQGEHSGEDPLGNNHGIPKKRSWVSQLHERHQVHPLIFSLLQQGMDPSVIPLHSSQGMEMPDHGRREAGDA